MDGRVLILDDDEDLLDSVAELIEFSLQRRVLRARSFAEVVQLEAQVLACELAILDVNLGPDKPSGLDALRWLIERKFAGRPVFLTGHAPGFPLVEEARRMGVQVLSKPVSSEQLLALFAPSP